VIISDTNVKDDELCSNDPLVFDCVSTKGHELYYAKVGLDAHLLPSMSRDKSYVFNKDSMSDYCGFA